MNKTELTVIVTNYNLERFLPVCLDSLAREDASLVEILIIDDGSTDQSPSLIDDYCVRYENFHSYRQTNGGLSRARNIGLDLATTSYVAFCDADDFVAPGYYTKLLQKALADDLEVVMGNTTYHFQGEQPDRPLYPADLPNTFASGHDWLRYHLRKKHLLHMACMQVYQRAFLNQHGLRFVPDLIHEDVTWTTRYLLLAERFAYLPDPGYHYRIHKRNVVLSDAKLQRIIDSSVFNATTLDSLAESLDDNELRALIRWQLVDGGLSIFHKLKKIANPVLRRDIARTLRKNSIFHILWRNAGLLTQKRRIARNWLSTLFL